jgi:hypothetical protein
MHDIFAGDHHDRRSNPTDGKEKEEEVHQDFPSSNAKKAEQP